MRYIPAILVAIASLLLVDPALSHQLAEEIAVGGRVSNPGPYDRIEGESLAALINRIGGIPATQAELQRHQHGERLLRVRINLYRDGKLRVFSVDPASDELWKFIIMRGDTIEVARAEPFKGVEYPTVIILKKQETAQAGHRRPASGTEPKPTGGGKPQPKTKPVSR